MARGQGCDRSLVEAKEFQAATQNFSVTIGFHGVMSRQGILCHDRVWLRPKGLVLRNCILCRDRVGLRQGSCVATEYLCRDRVWPNKEVLCCDRAILCRNIVGQAGKIFCLNGAFLGRDRVGQGREKLCRDRGFRSRQSWPQQKVQLPTTELSVRRPCARDRRPSALDRPGQVSTTGV